MTVDANLETLSSTDATDTLPETGEKDGTILTFSGVLSLASIALLELKRRKKSQ
ncbi:LPXTG cell wall anchor domain-containing protein [Pediococcus acidilactici]|uniref:LPXTG cell wall anchor domain-containing protein n=1 Tax=Pediococcus acidilactici TaxID=1254 RepID=UPI003A8FE2E2